MCSLLRLFALVDVGGGGLLVSLFVCVGVVEMVVVLCLFVPFLLLVVDVGGGVGVIVCVNGSNWMFGCLCSLLLVCLV